MNQNKFSSSFKDWTGMVSRYPSTFERGPHESKRSCLWVLFILQFIGLFFLQLRLSSIPKPLTILISISIIMAAVIAPQPTKWMVIFKTLTDKKLYIPFEFLSSDVPSLPNKLKRAVKTEIGLNKDISYKCLLKHLVVDIATISPVPNAPLKPLCSYKN